MVKDAEWTPFDDDDSDTGKEKPDSSFNKGIPTNQYLMAAHMLSAVNTSVEHKIDLICEAGMAIDWGKKQMTRDGIRTLYRMNVAVNLAFNWTEGNHQVYSIKWHPDLLETDKQYKDWFEPWDDKFEAIKELLPDNFQHLSEREQFIERTRVLSFIGFSQLKSVFFAFATPRAMRYYTGICKRLDIRSFEALKTSSFSSSS